MTLLGSAASGVGVPDMADRSLRLQFVRFKLYRHAISKKQTNKSIIIKISHCIFTRPVTRVRSVLVHVRRVRQVAAQGTGLNLRPCNSYPFAQEVRTRGHRARQRFMLSGSAHGSEPVSNSGRNELCRHAAVLRAFNS